ncbi:MAG: TetR/AcrR family transcriptional regulator [Rhodomicrobiaceae bacterium]
MRTAGQRDPDRTRRAILDAATAEFVSKGFAGASVNEIADRANVNKRMLYHYFGKKDELYVAVLEKVYASLRAAQGQLKLTDLAPREAIEKLILFTWDYYLKHPEFLSLMAIENMLNGKYALSSEHIRDVNAPLMEALKDVLRRGQKQRVFKANVDPLHLYLTIASLGSFFVCARFTLSGLVGRDLASPAELDTRARHIIEVVLGYLRP